MAGFSKPQHFYAAGYFFFDFRALCKGPSALLSETLASGAILNPACLVCILFCLPACLPAFLPSYLTADKPIFRSKSSSRSRKSNSLINRLSDKKFETKRNLVRESCMVLYCPVWYFMVPYCPVQSCRVLFGSYGHGHV